MAASNTIVHSGLPEDEGVQCVKPKLNVVIVGCIGAGKSTLGNLILSITEGGFPESDTQPQQTSGTCSGTCGEFDTSIVETLGFEMFDNDIPTSEAAKDYVKDLIRVLKECQEMKHIDVIIYTCSYKMMERLAQDVTCIETFMNETIIEGLEKRFMMVVTNCATEPSPVTIEEFKAHKSVRNKPQVYNFINNTINNRFILIDSKDNQPRKYKDLLLKYFRHMKRNNDELLSKASFVQGLEGLLRKQEAGSCFPGSAKIMTATGMKKMAELQIGDQVKTWDKLGRMELQPVMFMTHADQDAVAEYIEVTTEDGKSLRLTPGHYIPGMSLDKLVAARDLRVGDVVFTINEVGQNLIGKHISSMKRVSDVGLYCPHTVEGTLVVDGVAVSCYTDFMHPVLAHILLKPVLWIYKFLPTSLFKWSLPSDLRGIFRQMSPKSLHP